ncbi:hypothetical protein CDL15_Pgr019762 [Punica granatum]|nr:hypothetical protein CDL15_Pgr019762 [Punica granatum]PKI63732.1 hypothetical protein CRG98_015853 [Punica granatum]
MASSSSNKFHHARSNSLPSRPHPVVSQVEENLHSTRASGAASSTSSLTSNKLTGLQDLHESVEKPLSLALVQMGVTQQSHERWVDELLDGSLRLLDLCCTAKNSLLQTKEALQELQ